MCVHSAFCLSVSSLRRLASSPVELFRNEACRMEKKREGLPEAGSRNEFCCPFVRKVTFPMKSYWKSFVDPFVANAPRFSSVRQDSLRKTSTDRLRSAQDDTFIHSALLIPQFLRPLRRSFQSRHHLRGRLKVVSSMSTTFASTFG